ncbi:glycosyltransferase [Pleurocapsa sp. PCC 7327]|uniref:glycosyltransferase family 4 protein n=1 Tax=Pleurocapsa sp. PCC 7327 TaxID=118163 RepID=UPI00029FF9DA|nr:glycosyltransferase family 4 protein [Pleurocapsa sp. PCC 7327]AFY77363.1 glycosyltransferase [Pleurocapsa sp. PCC 7327]
MSTANLRVLIVAEHASFKLGGEAALPLHYFRILRRRGIETWLVVHERTRDELKSLFPQECDRIYFIADTIWHKFLWQVCQLLPGQLGNFTTGFVMRFLTQILQRRLAKQIVKEKNIDLVHQPIPVSPREPSTIFGMGVPVVIGPMNGGMDYPPAFQRRQNPLESLIFVVGRFLSNFFNILIPGKRQATILLVANARTKRALPKSVFGEHKIVELVENGVDLSIWQNQYPTRSLADNEAIDSHPSQPRPTKFIYIGRLVDWKAVDLLFIAVKQVLKQVPVEIEIIGDGNQKTALQEQAKKLGLLQSGSVHFLGWLSQVDCAKRLKSADALVLPSLCECGGAVILEAMAMGIPVIATNWGGPTDYLDESCGILVEPSSREGFIDGLATAMVKLATNPELARQMGRVGKQKIVDCFDWEIKVDKVLEIYQKSIAFKSFDDFLKL